MKDSEAQYEQGAIIETPTYQRSSTVSTAAWPGVMIQKLPRIMYLNCETGVASRRHYLEIIRTD